MNKIPVSAVVIVKNEEQKIKQCLESLINFDQIIVIDDFSTDGTLQICQQYSADVYQRELKSDFASQRNYALNFARNDWVFFIDADEYISIQLQNEIGNLIKGTTYDGYYLKRQDFFINKLLNYGDSGSFCQIRLAQKKSGKWFGKVHEKWIISNPGHTLKHKIMHKPHDSINEMINSINYYSSIRAKELNNLKVKSTKLDIVIFPSAKFIQNYFIRLGFKDGSHGMVHAIIMSFYSFLVRSKLYLINKNAK